MLKLQINKWCEINLWKPGSKAVETPSTSSNVANCVMFVRWSSRFFYKGTCLTGSSLDLAIINKENECHLSVLPANTHMYQIPWSWILRESQHWEPVIILGTFHWFGAFKLSIHLRIWLWNTLNPLQTHLLWFLKQKTDLQNKVWCKLQRRKYTCSKNKHYAFAKIKPLW